MSSISIKAVIISAVFDVVLSNVAGLAVFFVIAASSAGTDLNADSLKALATTPMVWAISLTIGGLVSILAGYLAAHIAGRGHLLNGALSSILCVLLGVYVIVSGSSPEHLSRQIMELPVSPLLGMLGGYLCRLRAGAMA